MLLNNMLLIMKDGEIINITKKIKKIINLAKRVEKQSAVYKNQLKECRKFFIYK
jgi:hypothetical protein